MIAPPPLLSEATIFDARFVDEIQKGLKALITYKPKNNQWLPADDAAGQTNFFGVKEAVERKHAARWHGIIFFFLLTALICGPAIKGRKIALDQRRGKTTYRVVLALAKQEWAQFTVARMPIRRSAPLTESMAFGKAAPAFGWKDSATIVMLMTMMKAVEEMMSGIAAMMIATKVVIR